MPIFNLLQAHRIGSQCLLRQHVIRLTDCILLLAYTSILSRAMLKGQLE
jgi:hypothetical protein